MTARSQQHVRPNDRRARILGVAARLFAERGVKNVTVRDVAVAAGVTHPLIYYYWSSKEDLLASTVEHSQARMRRIADVEPDPLDAVVAFVRESLEHNRQYLQTLTRALLDGMSPADWPGGYPGIDGALRRLTEGVEPGSTCDKSARERLACVVAMLLGWSLIEEPLFSMVGLPSDAGERARAAMFASIRQVIEPDAECAQSRGRAATGRAGSA